jgi:hypothetical protein
MVQGVFRCSHLHSHYSFFPSEEAESFLYAIFQSLGAKMNALLRENLNYRHRVIRKRLHSTMISYDVRTEGFPVPPLMLAQRQDLVHLRG